MRSAPHIPSKLTGLLTREMVVAPTVEGWGRARRGREGIPRGGDGAGGMIACREDDCVSGTFVFRYLRESRFVS